MPAAPLVTPDLVALDRALDSPAAATDALLDLAVAAGRVTDRDAARAALRARREESPVGVGLGVAVPHAQTDAVTAPTVAFVRAADGVDFDAPDGAPADLLVLILVPANAAADHRSVLRAVSRGLVDDDVRDRLRAADDPAAVVSLLREVVP